MNKNIAVVTSKKGDIYQVKKLEKDNNELENLTKGGSGTLNDEQCKKLFTIPIVLNSVINENPLVI